MTHHDDYDDFEIPFDTTVQEATWIDRRADVLNQGVFIEALAMLRASGPQGEPHEGTLWGFNGDSERDARDRDRLERARGASRAVLDAFAEERLKTEALFARMELPPTRYDAVYDDDADILDEMAALDPEVEPEALLLTRGTMADALSDIRAHRDTDQVTGEALVTGVAPRWDTEWLDPGPCRCKRWPDGSKGHRYPGDGIATAKNPHGGCLRCYIEFFCKSRKQRVKDHEGRIKYMYDPEGAYGQYRQTGMVNGLRAHAIRCPGRQGKPDAWMVVMTEFMCEVPYKFRGTTQKAKWLDVIAYHIAPSNEEAQVRISALHNQWSLANADQREGWDNMTLPWSDDPILDGPAIVSPEFLQHLASRDNSTTPRRTSDG